MTLQTEIYKNHYRSALRRHLPAQSPEFKQGKHPPPQGNIMLQHSSVCQPHSLKQAQPHKEAWGRNEWYRQRKLLLSHAVTAQAHRSLPSSSIGVCVSINLSSSLHVPPPVLQLVLLCTTGVHRQYSQQSKIKEINPENT